jgi:uncharacterized membrane protein (DUF485 family)
MPITIEDKELARDAIHSRNKSLTKLGSLILPVFYIYLGIFLGGVVPNLGKILPLFYDLLNFSTPLSIGKYFVLFIILNIFALRQIKKTDTLNDEMISRGLFIYKDRDLRYFLIREEQDDNFEITVLKVRG